MKHKIWKSYKTKLAFSKAMAVALSASMLVGNIGTTAYAQTVSSSDLTVSGSDTNLLTVSRNNLFALNRATGYENFTTNEVIGDFALGTSGDIAAEAFNGTYGFNDIEYNAAATGWSGGVYYPREASKDAAGTSYVTASADYLTIAGKAWTETEETGYGVYTYENTSVLSMALENADYQVDVTLVNPTGSEYSAYLESEDITKVTDIKVAAGASVTKSFTACLIDGTLDLKFLASSAATSEAAAQTQNVYVSKVKVTRLATEEAGSKPTIFLASDSTVQTYDSSVYPQTGWGQTLAEFFGGIIDERECEDCDFSQSQTYEAKNVIVENRALGGRSSKSYVEEGKLDDILEDIKKGDYLFIQWGHNDATAARPNRYVADSDFEYWIQQYVDGALQRGATPVLVTPVARYSYDKTTGLFVGNFENYGNVMRNMSSAQGIPLVDLTQRSVALCNSFGIEGAKSLFLHTAAGEYPAHPDGIIDDTHLQYYGAYKFAQCVAQGVKENSALSSLAALVEFSAPTAAPATVTNLASTTVGASSVGLKWDEVEGAELYYIYRQVLTEGMTIADVDFSNASKYSVTPNARYTDSNCEAGTTYVYAVKGFNEQGMSADFSNLIEVKTKEAGYKFDFNGGSTIGGAGPTMAGWIGIDDKIMYAEGSEYGWITAPTSSRYRANNGNADSSDMADDFFNSTGEFAVTLPNGDYEVTVYAADLLPGTSSIKPSYTAEGLAVGSISTKQALSSVTGTVRVEDGILNLNVGGTNPQINGMTITELLLAPSGLNYSELTMNEITGQATFLIGFVPVEGAVSYNVYGKNSSDKNYSVIKSFTTDEYAADDLACRAMVGDIGEQYSYYMTCVTADGSESARSNIIELSLIQDGPKAAAPANLICTSPLESDTELKMEVSLQWDAVEGAIKYIIYRSDVKEGDKGFVAFEKIGESKSLTYTDANDAATNIPHYYKVAALTKTGVGNLSEVCVSPVAGSLVTGGRESYSDRAVVAINLAGGDGAEVNVSATDKDGNELTSGVYVSWRSFYADYDSDNSITTTFDVYRNETLIADDISFTNLVDEGGSASDVYKVIGSNDGDLGLTTVPTNVWANKYLELSLYCPADATMPDGSTTSYSANDMSVGDLDGDGNLELLVKWYPGNAQDNSISGYTGKTYIDAYEVNFATGAVSLLWRIDMGVNIRSGAHYTQFQVWDYDGDGKAEVAVKTADGTTSYKSTDGTAAGLVETCYVGACNSDALPENTISTAYDYRNSSGYILNGTEYFSIFNGEDGTKAADDVAYLPGRGEVAAWGDGHGNRVDRFLSGTAYLDGQTPFAIFTRGYYTRTCLTAYYMKDTDSDGVGDTIATYWQFDTNEAGTQYEAQGNHGLSINDIDNDGKDEIIYGALTIDHNGTVKYSTNLGHGDAMHVSDWVTWNPGLEIMAVHEHDDAAYHVEVHDAETGILLMGYNTGKDTGRGVAADIDPTAEGAEWWSIASPTYEDNEEPAWNSTNGEVYSTWSTMENLIKLSDSTPASNFSIFWDADLMSEIQDHTFNEGAYVPIGAIISDWNYETDAQETLLYSEEIWSNNGTKGNLGLVADILGDWREEIITRTSANKNNVRIYSTTIETDYVVPCLLENLEYREGVAWQNVGYNQPANVKFMLSQGLVTAKADNVATGSGYVQFDFTAANDGDLYGHDIIGYEIYRAEGDGEFELHDTFRFDDTTDGRTSFKSEIITALTDVLMIQKPEITLADIVQGTPIEAGKTVADFFPTTIDVVDTDGLSQKALVTWDASAVDINTVGTYDVIATVEGWAEPITVPLKIIPNEIKGYVAMDPVIVLKGQAISGLPEKVSVSYTNTTTEEIAVTWDTSIVDINVVDDYTVEGTLATQVGGLDSKPTIVVKVVDDYITEVAVAYCEVEVNSTDVAAAMPAKVTATWATGNKTEETATWTDLSEVKADTVGTYNAKGTIAGFDGEVTASVYVAYPAVYRFDFKIESSASNTAEGWTSVVVNNASGTKQFSELGSLYTVDQGWGFSEDGSCEGRNEDYTYAGYIPKAVYKDFAIPDGKIFEVDLPNGTYYVEVVGGSAYKSTVKATIAGETKSIGNTAGTYAIGTWDSVEVTDRKLKIDFTPSQTARMDAIIIREVERAAAQLEIIQPDAVEVVQNTTAVLPEKVTVIKEDGSMVQVAVTWDTSTLQVGTIGNYTVNGTLNETIEGLTQVPSVTVNVVADYVDSIAMSYVEIEIDTTDVAAEMPATVSATWASSKVEDINVTWNVSNVDATTAGCYDVTGTIAGSDVQAEAKVYIVYPIAYAFDFGANTTMTGFTQINMDSASFENHGTYGFTNESKAKSMAAIRLGTSLSTIYNLDTIYNSKYADVFDDSIRMDYGVSGEFKVSVPNGKYLVEVLTHQAGNTSASNITVNGISLGRVNDKHHAVVLPREVEVTDGIISVTAAGEYNAADAGKNRYAFLNGIVIREVDVEHSGEVTDPVTTIDKTYVEVEQNATDVASLMPTTVKATYQSGATADLAVTWDLSAVDTAVAGDYNVTGTVAGITMKAEAVIYVVYPVVYAFDFGATTDMTGFTPITVSSDSYETNGTYGFTDASLALTMVDYKVGNATSYDSTTYSATAQYGEDYANVFVDSVQMGYGVSGEFKVNVPNGTYVVEVLTHQGNTTAASNIAVNGTTLARVNSKNVAFALGAEVEVTDGVISVTCAGEYNADNATKNRYAFLNGIVIRKVAVTGGAGGEDPDEPTNAYKFDFGRAGDPVMTGFTEINASSDSYETHGTYGFTNATLATTGAFGKRGIAETQTYTDETTYNSTYDDAFTDGYLTANAGEAEFIVNVPNGKYDVVVLVNHGAATCKSNIHVEGVTDTTTMRCSTKNQSYVATCTTTITDGTINIKAVGQTQGGQDYPAMINAVIINPVEEEPAQTSFKFDLGRAGDPVMTGFTEINATSDSYETNGTYGFTNATLATTGAFGKRGIAETQTYTDETTYNSTYDDAFTDGYLTANAGEAEFIVNVPNGTYDVVVLVNHGAATCKSNIYVEGVTDTTTMRCSTKNQSYVATCTTTIADGTINIKAVGQTQGGQDYPAMINAIIINPSTTTASANVYSRFNNLFLSEASELQETGTLARTANESTLVEKEGASELTYTYTDMEDVKSNTTYRYKIAAIVLDEPATAEPTPEPEVDKKYQHVISTTIPESVLTEEVKKNTGCETVEELIQYMIKQLTTGFVAGQILSGIKPENTSVIDITVRISFDGGITWEDITAENFPAEGVDVVIPYPEGTDKDKHDFVIGHMVTMGCNGRIPGVMEYYDPEETEDGLKICIKSASPFIIGWKDAEVSEEEPDDEKVSVEDTEDTDDDEQDDSDDSTPVTDSKTSPKTYDDSKASTKGQKDVATQDGNAQENSVDNAVDDTVVSVAVPPQTSSNWLVVLIIVAIAAIAITTGIKIYRNKFEEF